MNKWHITIIFVLAATLLLAVSCNKDDGELYPSILTSTATLWADAEGYATSLVVDNDSTYNALYAVDKDGNETAISGLPAGDGVRVICNYEQQPDGRVRIYGISSLANLRDCSSLDTLKHDPLTVVSVWKGGGFVNMHLKPKSAGGLHSWGFLRDSVRTNVLGGQTHYISLFHDQKDDPFSYSRDVYACIGFDTLATVRTAKDSFELAIHTFDGVRRFRFTSPSE